MSNRSMWNNQPRSLAKASKLQQYSADDFESLSFNMARLNMEETMARSKDVVGYMIWRTCKYYLKVKTR